VSGFAVIHRSLLGHPAFRNDAEVMAFAWMILRASWKPVRVRYKGKAISLNRGQLSVSQRDMAEALDRDKAWIERLWKRLKSEAMIEVASEAGVAVITICNYAKYQDISERREAVDKAPDEADARQTQGTEQQDKPLNQLTNKENSCASDDAPVLKPEHVVEIWNETAPRIGKPSVRDITPERRQLLKARIGQYALEDFQSVFGKIERSAFLSGWRGCGFDWVFKKANFQKILEGNYDQ